jgi:hypothetical protein
MKEKLREMPSLTARETSPAEGPRIPASRAWGVLSSRYASI